MRIALIGHGKMGKMIETLAREGGHEIVHIIGRENAPGAQGFSGEWVEKTDVFIDFSVPEAVRDNVKNAARAGLPIVVGTTGWDQQREELRSIVQRSKGACVHSANFSVGVQVLFTLVRHAGEIFSQLQDFHPFILEAHHAQKVDAPSGTALTLREILREACQSEIPVSSVRAGFIPGEHLIGFDSPVDTLILQHRARSREGFARGALYAAKWILGKSGFYSFEELLFGGERS